MNENYQEIKKEYEKLKKQIIDCNSRIEQILKIQEVKEFTDLIDKNAKFRKSFN